jgi:hypothetical protein
MVKNALHVLNANWKIFNRIFDFERGKIVRKNFDWKSQITLNQLHSKKVIIQILKLETFYKGTERKCKYKISNILTVYFLELIYFSVVVSITIIDDLTNCVSLSNRYESELMNYELMAFGISKYFCESIITKQITLSSNLTTIMFCPIFNFRNNFNNNRL